MDKLLIVEDEEIILQGLKENFELEDYIVETAIDGEDAIAKVEAFQPRLILLDIMIPKKSGLEVCRYVRKKFPHIYIIMLTAKSEESSKLTGLEMGADDYVTKPFSILELIARVKAFLRRAAQNPAGDTLSSQNTFETDIFSFDFLRFIAKKNNEEVDLNAKEFQILNYFCQHVGEVVSREDLLEQVWGYQPDNLPTTRTVDNHIVKLRQKLEGDPTSPEYILSVRGAGYKFNG